MSSPARLTRVPTQVPHFEPPLLAQHLVLVAPRERRSSLCEDARWMVSAELHDDLLDAIQRLRGATYVADGAIAASRLDAHGRHREREDDDAWHLAITDAGGEVVGCVRCLSYPPGTHFDELTTLRDIELARSAEMGFLYRRAVDYHLGKAERAGRSIVVPGGWAVDASHRRSSIAFQLLAGVHMLCRQERAAACIATATLRHGSAAMLRRLGAEPLAVAGTEVSRYFEPKYGCDMEALVVTSQDFAARIRRGLRLPSETLAVCRDGRTVAHRRSWAAPQVAER